MDYKEKYEQALERARQFSEKPYLEDSAGIVEYIFPELKESEDEEMKREIIEFLKSRAGFKQEWIDWLNKQSEKKESYIDMSLVDAVRFCVADNLAHKSTDDNGNTIGFGVYIDDTTAQKLTNELSDIFQKSIEWSEDDKTRLDEIVTHLKGMVSVSDIDFLKSLKDRVLPQPKQEWSEEDEEILKELTKFIPYHLTAHSYNQYYNWAISHRPQPHWKPSDEQMKALNDVISSRDIRYDVLSELWKDLKKLK